MDKGSKELEIWRSVVGFEGLYEVSDQGNVRGVERVCPDGRKVKGKQLKPHIFIRHKENYWLNLCLRKNNKRNWLCVHNIVAKAFPDICGEWFDGAEADHLNGKGYDNRAVNIRLKTHKDNVNNPITREKQRTTLKTAVLQLTENGEIVKVWETARAAEIFFKRSRSNIAYHIRKHTPLQGFYFAYADKQPDQEKMGGVHHFPPETSPLAVAKYKPGAC